MADLVLNVLFCRRVCFLQMWTFRTRSAVVLNVHFCRKWTLLQKRTFGTTAVWVLNIHVGRTQTLLQKTTFRSCNEGICSQYKMSFDSIFQNILAIHHVKCGYALREWINICALIYSRMFWHVVPKSLTLAGDSLRAFEGSFWQAFGLSERPKDSNYWIFEFSCLSTCFLIPNMSM